MKHDFIPNHIADKQRRERRMNRKAQDRARANW